MKLLKIGAFEIPQHACLDLDQHDETIAPGTIHRSISGTAIKQTTWRKARVTFSGGGWSRPGFDAIDFNQQQIVSFLNPAAVIADINREAPLPAARRTDAGYLPFGFAFMPGGGRVQTPLVIISDVATLDAVPNAIGYQANYYPEITCWVMPPTESTSRGDASYRWELVAEEV